MACIATIIQGVSLMGTLSVFFVRSISLGVSECLFAVWFGRSRLEYVVVVQIPILVDLRQYRLLNPIGDVSRY